MSRDFMPEPVQFNGGPLPETEPDGRYEAEELRERLHWEFECVCREFAASDPDGWPAVLRAVARAMKLQGELVEK